MTGKIYMITNDLNDKIYVGQTIQSLGKRFKNHCCHTKSDRSENMYIKRAIHKYGKEHFHIVLLEEVDINLLDEREKYWIERLDSYNNGYNLTKGGQVSKYSEDRKLENRVDVDAFIAYIIEFTPRAVDVAKKFGICTASVYHLAKRLDNPNLVFAQFDHHTMNLTDVNWDEFEADYADGWSIRDLMKKYHVSKRRASSHLKNKGIKIRRGVSGYKSRI